MTDHDTSSALPADVQQHVQNLEAQVHELQASQYQVRSLFHDAPVASVLLTPEGRIQDLNTLAYGLLNLPREPQSGRRFSSLLTPASQSAFNTLLKQVLETPIRQSIEAQLPQQDGPSLDLRLDLSVCTIDGQVAYAHLVVTDITAYKEAYRTLLDGHTSLDQQIQDSAAKARALNEELEQVVAAVLQELYLPASRVMSALGLLRQALGDVPEAVAKPVLHIERGAQQLLAIIQSVERYMQHRHFRPRIRRVDLKAVLQNVLKEIQPLLAERDVRITHDPLPVIQGDSQALNICLNEYIANSLKYTRTREQARIHVHVRETDSEYVIGVEDNGVGFNMRNKDRLFRLFQRQHPSSVYEGSGLGLATVRRVVERFGGRTWAEGKVDHGATFWFAWPKGLRSEK